jgi:hypothetical protein
MNIDWKGASETIDKITRCPAIKWHIWKGETFDQNRKYLLVNIITWRQPGVLIKQRELDPILMDTIAWDLQNSTQNHNIKANSNVMTNYFIISVKNRFLVWSLSFIKYCFIETLTDMKNKNAYLNISSIVSGNHRGVHQRETIELEFKDPIHGYLLSESILYGT